MAFKTGSPGCPCFGPNICQLIEADFSSLAIVQSEWTLRSGSWDDVDGTGTELELQADGVELLAINEPTSGVRYTTGFRGRNGSVIRFYAGADADVSVFAEITFGEFAGFSPGFSQDGFLQQPPCAQLWFYEESIAGGETRIGDVHWIREMRGEEWHRITICYDPTRGYLTATITTLAGETWAYSTAITIGGTSQPGYGIGVTTGTAEFKSFSATAAGLYVERDPDVPCGSVAVTTTRAGSAGTPIVAYLYIYEMPENHGKPPGYRVFTFYLNSYSHEFQVRADLSSEDYTDVQAWIQTLPGYELATFDAFRNLTLPPPLVLGNASTTWFDYTTSTEETFNARVDDPGTPQVNEQQTIVITGNPDGGIWSLSDGGATTGMSPGGWGGMPFGGPVITTALAHDASAATVRAALESLGSIGTGNVTVSGPAGGPYVVTFVGDLAAQDVGALTASSHFTGCDCPYDTYSYTYADDCHHDCPTCNPSCSLAGSAFSANLSSCDWDGAGYVFGNGTATGTGTLTHRTEIYTIPLAATAIVTGLLESDVTDGHSFTLDIAGVTIVVSTTKVDDEYRIGLTTNAVDGGYISAITCPTVLVLRVCRNVGMAIVTISRTFAICELQQNVTGLADPTYPTYLSVTTDSTEVQWTSVMATRGHGWYDACSCYGGDDNYPKCGIIDVCEDRCLDSKWPSSVAIDITGIVGYSFDYVPYDGMGVCRYTSEIIAVFVTPSHPQSNRDAMCLGVARVGLYRWIAESSVTVLKGSDIDIGTLDAEHDWYGEWVPEPDHYYLLATVGGSIEDYNQRMWSYSFMYTSDLGDTAPSCMDFDDVACVFRGSSMGWIHETTAVWDIDDLTLYGGSGQLQSYVPGGGIPDQLNWLPCSTEGNSVPGGGIGWGDHYVNHTGIIYITSQ